MVATPKKAAAAAQRVECVLHRKRRDERRGCKNRDKKRFRKKSFPPRAGRATRATYFFSFFAFSFFGFQRNSWNNDPPHTGFSPHRKRKQSTKHKRAQNTATMSAKLMDATPDLKRLAPVENLAIDVISYAHGSVTPTLTNLYSKGKESFLKVYKIFFSITGAFLSSSSSSLVNENFFSSFFSRRTNESDDFE